MSDNPGSQAKFLIFMSILTSIFLVIWLLNRPEGSDNPVDPRFSNPQDARATALIKAKSCYACHRVSTKQIGPSYSEVANRYRSTPDPQTVLQDLMSSVRKGSVGKYGDTPMVALGPDAISDEDLTYVLNWIIKLK